MGALPPPSERSAALTPPEPFLLGILHLLLAPFAAPLPPVLLSQTTRQAIHYLSIAPDDETYWTCGRRDEAVATRRGELIEAGNLDDLVLSLPHFAFDLDETKCLITLSLPFTEPDRALGVVLVWEDNTSPLAAATGAAPAPSPTSTGSQRTPGQISDDDVRPGWTFLELQALDAPPEQLTTAGPGGRRRPSWYPSLGEAVEAATSSLAGSLAPVQVSARASAGRENAEAGARDGEREEERKKLRAAMNMDDGEGTTPGAIGSAEDFWAGWSDDEKDAGGDGAPAVREEEQDDAGYWDSYGGVDSQVGGEDDDDRDTIEALSPSPDGAPITRVHRSFTITTETANLASAASAAPEASRLAPPPASSAPSPQHKPYFSNNLPPLSPSHFGLSPTQPNLDESRFSANSGSQYSGGGSSRSPVQPSPPASPQRATPSTPTRQTAPPLTHQTISPSRAPVSPTRSTFSPIRQAVSPSRQPISPGRQAFSPQPALSPQQPPLKQQGSPRQKRGHLRQASDILKALPSFPAFPVMSRKSDSRSAPSTPSAVPDPPGANGGAGGYFASRPPHPPSQAQAEPPRSPAKALPPAPALGPSQHQQPATFAPQYANLIPVGAGVVRTESVAQSRAPPPTVQHPPPPSHPSLAASPARAATQKRPSTAVAAPSAPIPPDVERHGSLTSPLPSTAVFPSPSSAGAAPPRPLFAPPPAPPAAAERAAERVRLDRLASVGSIGGLSIASTSLTGLTGVLGELEAVNGRAAALFPLPPSSSSAAPADEGAKEREESLAFAMAGLWGLFSAAAATGQEREERRRQWERVAGQVVRS